ncbi:hypothetical protein SPRG_12099 [Saprolegnia parasitica CBS 223.65]|uniref:Uncharacterized protein n=1 Tax=Saprolegnia parasitica (strain CBS 223.65) TaxID=695850 RepID=A0A067C6V4_SAPPC|nr:hypothetical protein SPRG_12099 [Saprolegnia parasitica CBS 223.65]KDO22261.1 hypothetical protein SPRG_12099 [Saprolegnia parasitica CBS 223.65]|eukprot:XP_012206997.1 hypothetical protein SPRG_12099 [Saprolegnia parasitica CBS 223.65]
MTLHRALRSLVDLANQHQWTDILDVLAANAHVPDLNAVDAKGLSALARACRSGQRRVVIALLEQSAIDLFIEDRCGLTALDWAKREGHDACARLVESAAYAQVHSAHESPLQADVDALDGAFDEQLFARAVRVDVPSALRMLDSFVAAPTVHKHVFSNLHLLYGMHDAKTSALYSILNAQRTNPEGTYACLGHVAVQRVLDIKWALFGQRRYIHQILVFALVLMAMTVSVATAYATAKTAEVSIYKAAIEACRGRLADNVCLYEKFNATFRDQANATSRRDQDNATYTALIQYTGIQLQFVQIAWVPSICFVFFGLVYAQQLQPTRLWQWARYANDGTWGPYDAAVTLPHWPQLQAAAKRLLMRRVLYWTCATSFFPIVCAVTAILRTTETIPHWIIPNGRHIYISYTLPWLTWSTATVLWCGVLYFLLLEYRELRSEDRAIEERREKAEGVVWLLYTLLLFVLLPWATPFLRRYRRYYASGFNLFQLVIFSFVLLYVPLHLIYAQSNASPDLNNDPVYQAYICIGATATLGLWMMSTQFLQIHPTGGYLVPLLMDIVTDVRGIALLFSVVQLAPKYATLYDAFFASYLVLYGGLQLDDFTGDAGKYLRTYTVGNKVESKFVDVVSPALVPLGIILRMVQVAMYVVVLANLLIAMMNKTVEKKWDTTRARADVSAAECVLRLERTSKQTIAARQAVMYMDPPKTVSGPVRWVRYCFGLRPAAASVVAPQWLHPLFTEHVWKYALRPLDALATDDDKDEAPTSTAVDTELQVRLRGIRTKFDQLASKLAAHHT